jgi:adenosylcobinamide-GDP ribazoletransferase
MSGLRTAWIFLTRVPIGDDPHPDVSRAVPWFPLVGAIVGGVAAAVWALSNTVLSPLPSAALAVTAAALLTGAFHQDGLADMADGFGGGWDPEQRLRIMKDSRHGTYGVMALVCVALLQVSALSALGRAQGVAALVAAHTLGRAGAVALLAVARPARDVGLGAGHALAVRRDRAIAGMLAAVAVAVLALGAGALIASVAVVLAVGGCAALSQRKIRGITGDVLGAAEQLGETAALLVAAALAHRGVDFPWWS